MVKLVGVIRKPLDVNEWPFWAGKVTGLDGTRIAVNVGNIHTIPSSTTGTVPQDILMIDGRTAINIKWIHEMEFVYD